MKILYLITRAERGGAQIHVRDLMQGFRSQCEMEVASGEDGFLLEEARNMNVRCHILPSLGQPMRPYKDLKALSELFSLLRKTKPDLIHAHTSKAGVLGRMAAFFCNIPSVFTAHTWCFAEGTSRQWKLLGGPLEKIAAHTGGPIINVSEANRQLALDRKIGRVSQLVTIHNGIPDEDEVSTFTCAEPPVIVMVARFVPQKNQAMLLHALAGITTPFRVQFAGDGPTRAAVEALAAQLGLAEKVEFLGDRSDIAKILSRASIFALPTNWEGFPLSILEAMRSGLPIVVSDVGGVRESVIDGNNGYLIARHDTAGFTRSLEILLASGEQRRKMGQASRALFKQKFTSQHMLRKTFEIYQKATFPKFTDYCPAQIQPGKNN